MLPTRVGLAPKLPGAMSSKQTGLIRWSWDFVSGLICGLMQRQEFPELPELCFEPAIYDTGSMAWRLGWMHPKYVRNWSRQNLQESKVDNLLSLNSINDKFGLPKFKDGLLWALACTKHAKQCQAMPLQLSDFLLRQSMDPVWLSNRYESKEM